MHKLTDKQASFVAHITTTPNCIGNGAAAARAAGYSAKSAKEIASGLLNLPHIQEAIEKSNRSLICGSLATKAVHVLERIIDDEKQSMKLRLDAAKTILDRAGYVPPKAEDPEAFRPPDKPSSEMTKEELHNRITYLRRITTELTVSSEIKENSVETRDSADQSCPILEHSPAVAISMSEQGPERMSDRILADKA